MLFATPITVKHGLLYSSMTLFIMSVFGIIAGITSFYLDVYISKKF